MRDVYTVITDRIITMLEKGTIPWQKPWRGGRAGAPKNLLSTKEYRGINVLLLSCNGYESPYWLTFKQAQSIGGHVNADEKGSMIIKALYLEDEDNPSKTKFRGMMSYHVFNTAQCTLPASLAPLIGKPETVPHDRRIAQAEAIVENMQHRPAITNCEPEREKVAYYNRSKDFIQIPALSCFDQPEAYYNVIFHELGHSTGHTSRLDRETLKDSLAFGDCNYSKEELTAEMTAAFLQGVAGIEENTLSNSASYIDGWLSRLKKDKTLLVQAAREAQKAADYILGTPKPAATTDND